MKMRSLFFVRIIVFLTTSLECFGEWVPGGKIILGLAGSANLMSVHPARRPLPDPLQKRGGRFARFSGASSFPALRESAGCHRRLFTFKPYRASDGLALAARWPDREIILGLAGIRH